MWTNVVSGGSLAAALAAAARFHRTGPEGGVEVWHLPQERAVDN